MGSVNSTADGVGSYFLILDNSGTPLFYSQTQSLGGLECNGLFSSRTEIEGLKKKYTWHLQNEEFDEVDTLQMAMVVWRTATLSNSCPMACPDARLR